MPILAAKESEGEEGGWAEPERDGQECNPGPIVVEYYHRRGDRLAPSPNPGQNEWKDQAAIESQRNEGRLLEVNGNMQVFRSKLGTQLYLEHSRRHSKKK
ncbi:uncharacterized protein [Drosophila pseudoobscura]|uniref:Uncharacterized protein isoform X6 n=1 Tax=Drosophila pseudoobscura pseudoobscura TaxID=46245 RepID=A0A6I8VEU9_DROPS|nr:uncharacterized protein LOC26533523 isoform X6 [Drosophila pseudoobscura]